MALKFLKRSLLVASSLSMFTASSFATIVEIQTSQGNVEVNLFDNATPKTVANFLSYINDGSYNTTVIHRSVKGFIVQGGGFTYDGAKLVKADTKAAVVNEPVYSNVKGTIAMAKLGSDANIATNQWFFNMADNSENLDFQNGGFTVFGQVVSGFDVLEKIQGLTHCGVTPLDNFTTAQCSTVAGFENFVSISNVDIKDATVDTAASLNPVKAKTTAPTGGDSGGGSVGFFALLGAILFTMRRRYF
ncbi:peptidylprolyl isomerase [Psychrobium sp. nBUS_13]|uniref:peptidylprolyl isomerase n=1 Tax=Psychrobium sp. nBUS_13 TaxID=3395319 RepID=UPI003EC067B6